MMKQRRSLLVFALLACLGLPSALLAQEPSTPSPAAAASAPQTNENFADVSGKGTFYTPGSDEGRAQRYRDLRGGGTLEFLRWSRNSDSIWWSVQADHTAYRDQRYSAAINDFGKFNGWFQFNEIPLYFSQQTQTLFTAVRGNPFSLQISDGIQSGLQNRTLTTSQAAALAQRFDLRLKRTVAEYKSTYSPSKNLDLDVWFWTTAKTGNRLVDALLWIKPPGTSDGPCNGGPPAGVFWPSYAVSLAANARW